MLLMPLLSACISDEIKIPESGPEGIPTRISLDVEVNDASTLTRGIDGNSVHSIWVGVYSKRTGELTGSLYQTANSDDKHIKHPISNLECKSGQSYIVAVANPDAYMGYTPSNPDGTGLLELLQGEQTKTWKGFRSIYVKNANSAAEAIISDPSPGNANPLLMSGHYYDYTDADTHPSDIVTVQDVYVPVAKETPVTMPGAIHLRRLWSEITFNVEPTGDVIELEVNSMRVNNVPSSSWLFERNQGNPSADAPEEYANSGDAISTPTNDVADKPYKPSASVGSGSMTVSDVEAADGIPAHKKYSYTFYMMENKRTGNDNCKDYAWRELEWGMDGQKPDPADASVATGKLSGNFVSLCPTNAPTYDNNATYVDINCDIKYRDKVTTPSINGSGEYPAIRTANVTYRVHLGYIGGDSKDFNTRRNSKYTYNVKARSADKVLVEALKNGEYQPGASGNITDVTEGYHELDAHYHVFTIKLTQEELNTFTWRMDSYDAGNLHTLDNNSSAATLAANTDYYDWVELVYNNGAADTDSNPVAYPSDRKKIKHLGDLNGGSDAGWYTVFINEYAYYADTDKKEDANWHRFANQPARRFWIYAQIATSHDGQSTYYTAKYAGEQQSIQTYFSENAPAALGAEHVNETFGMNLRWTLSAYQPSSFNSENGRKNVWYGTGLSNRYWSTYLNQTSQQNVNKITNTNQIGAFSKEARTYAVPALATLSISGTSNYSTRSSGASPFDPQTSAGSQYVQALFACMNRNRDLDGDGIIDAEELRWVLPSQGEFIRLILGENALPNPLISFSQNKLNIDGGSADYNPLYHYMLSDSRIFWTEQLMSISLVSNSGTWNQMPWQIRCVRNMGVNWNTAPGEVLDNTTGMSIDPAYKITWNGTGNPIVIPRYYKDQSMREPVYSPIPMHKVNSNINKISRYGFEVSSDNIDINSSYSGFITDVNAGSVCSGLITTTGKTGWRVPNQAEINLILRVKDSAGKFFIPDNSTVFYTSCTQEYYKKKEGEGSSDITTDYRIAAIIADPVTNNGNGRTPNMTEFRSYGSWYVKCVRDLTQAEFNAQASASAGRKSSTARKIVRKTRRR